MRCARNRAITQEYDSGKTTAGRLALKYRLTERQIRSILNSQAPEPKGRVGQMAMEF
ncbi:MAG: hypothetical protein HQL99_14265 [Magnetococcales bacterium]|nr:hypothetical protein [Magnetococcales bacterium]